MRKRKHKAEGVSKHIAPCRRKIENEWEGHIIVHFCTKPSGHERRGDRVHMCKWCPITLALMWAFKS